MTPPGTLRSILMTTDAVGGVWTYSLALCRSLAAEGIEVVLATTGPRPSDTQRAEVAELGNVILRESEFRLEWMSDPWDDVQRAGEWLLDLEQRLTPDIIHLNGYAHGALPWCAPVLVVGHSCVLSWWQAVRGGEVPASWNRYRDAVRAGLHAADVVVSPSHAMLDTLEATYGPLTRTAVIANGCDVAAFGPGEKQPFVLSVGRVWDEAKNIRALAEVAPEIDWPVCVAGDAQGPDGTGCVLANVSALGRCGRETLVERYASASLFVLPAFYEPFGLSVLEAALSGCALVLGDIPSLRENWDGAAAFVSPHDRAGLRATINELIACETRRRELGEAARARAQHFSVCRMADRYLKTYRQLSDDCVFTPEREALPA